MANPPDSLASASLSDEELAQVARLGDDSAMAALIARMMPVVRARAARYADGPLEAEDLMQEGMLGLLSAVYGYRTGAGASFRTYAGVCIGNRMVSALRLSSGRQYLPLGPEPEEYDIPEIAFSPEEQLIAQEDNERFSRILNERLSPLEQKVLRYYLGGRSYEEIAKRLGSTAKSVDNALQRVRRKLRFVAQGHC